MSRLKGLSVALVLLLVLQLMAPVFGNLAGSASAQSDDAGRVKIEKTSQTAEMVQWRVTVNASGAEHEGIQTNISLGAGLSPAGIADTGDAQVSKTGDGYTVQSPAGSGILELIVKASVTSPDRDVHEIKAVAAYPDGTFQASDRTEAIKPEVKEEEKPSEKAAEKPAEQQDAKAEEPVKKEEQAEQPAKEEQPAEEKEPPAEEAAQTEKPAEQPAKPSRTENAPEQTADPKEQEAPPAEEAAPKDDPAPVTGKTKQAAPKKETVIGTTAPVAVETDMMTPMAIATPGTYMPDPNAIVVPTKLEGISTNAHTIPHLMWISNGKVHVAVKSTHALQYMQFYPGQTNVAQSNTFDEYNAWVDIKVGGTVYSPDGLNGNTKDSHWTVFKFNSSDLFLLDNQSIPFFIKGIGGGHDVGGNLIVTVPTQSVTGNKAWVGGTERPAITLQLIAQAPGEAKRTLGTKVVNGTETPAWTHTWNDIPKYNPFGSPYTFTIDEASVPPNYKKSLNGLTVTNTYAPEQLPINVNKVWIGPKGESATIKLFANGADTGKTLTLNPQNNWTGLFTVNKFHDKTGEPITYTVKEVPVPGYTTQLSGSVTDGFTFTNTHSGTIDIKVNKAWIGPAAESVTINLQADGAPTGKSLVLNQENGWGGTFGGLRKYDAKTGAEIVYTVKEVPVPGYSSEVSGSAATGFTIKNTNDATTKIDVRKEWVGPEAGPVTIELLADGEETGKTVNLSGANNWAGSFSDLRKYDAETGEVISYSVTEPEVPERYKVSYSTGVNGEFIVTNTKLTGSLTITKVDEAGDPLAGAEFELRDQDGTVIGTGTSGADGKILFENLNWGSYLLVETKAPEGYRLLTKPVDVEIGADLLNVERTIENTPTDWELPATGGIGTIPFYMLGVLIMAVAAFILLKRKRLYE